MQGRRYLLVTADDFGIGPATSQGILDLAASGEVTSTVLLVNSPHAEEAVRAWQRAGEPIELGWHPCLTLDGPVLPPDQVPSLVDATGRFWPLGAFLRRLLLGQVKPQEIESEFRAQFGRFVDLLGRAPTVVNSHHHVQIFGAVGRILRQVLEEHRPLPYLRRIGEPWQTLVRVPGARRKRLLLSAVGTRVTRAQIAAGFPGNDWLVGVTDPPHVADPEFLARWLAWVPGRVVELTCHPGHWDTTLVGRDCLVNDGQQQRRVNEFELLRRWSFRESCRRAGFTLLSPRELGTISLPGSRDAA